MGGQEKKATREPTPGESLFLFGLGLGLFAMGAVMFNDVAVPGWLQGLAFMGGGWAIMGLTKRSDP